MWVVIKSRYRKRVVSWDGRIDLCIENLHFKCCIENVMSSTRRC